MKKSLIALAVVAATGAASAQSTVTLYGLVDAYVGSEKVLGGERNTVVNTGGVSSSRWGLRASEDLGGALKANFVLESGFSTDNGNSRSYVNPYTGATSNAIFGRQSWVGLSGGFGEVRLGKMWTPYDEVKGLGAAAFDANAFAPATYVWQSNAYFDNPGNAIYYATPSFGGFSAAAMVSLGENKAAGQSAGDITSFNIQYAGGPVALALSFQDEDNGGATGLAEKKYTQLNGSYDFGVAKLLAAYGQVKDKEFDTKNNEYQIGVEFPVSTALTLSAGYASSTFKATGVKTKATGFGLGAKYDMSKRTFVYAGLNSSKSEVPLAGDLKTRVYAVGVQHRF